jgi:hypothetical protein
MISRGGKKITTTINTTRTFFLYHFHTTCPCPLERERERENKLYKKILIIGGLFPTLFKLSFSHARSAAFLVKSSHRAWTPEEKGRRKSNLSKLTIFLECRECIYVVIALYSRLVIRLTCHCRQCYLHGK